MPPGGSPPLQGGGQNQKWPTCGQGGYVTPAAGQGGYITPAAWGAPTASERGAEAEVAHKWARWLPSNLVKKKTFFFSRFRNLVKTKNFY